MAWLASIIILCLEKKEWHSNKSWNAIILQTHTCWFDYMCLCQTYILSSFNICSNMIMTDVMVWPWFPHTQYTIKYLMTFNAIYLGPNQFRILVLLLLSMKVTLRNNLSPEWMQFFSIIPRNRIWIRKQYLSSPERHPAAPLSLPSWNSQWTFTIDCYYVRFKK